MLGDVAVAVHPDDERLKDLIGKNAILPLVGRRIPIIADEYADPEKGSGAVKITPAHDFNDFEVGKRHNLPLINIFDEEARLTLKDNEPFLTGRRHSRTGFVGSVGRCKSSIASSRASRSSNGLKLRAWSKRSSRPRMPCRTATAPTW